MKPLFMNYRGIGDALLLNTVLFHLGRQEGRRVILGTNRPEMYRGNPYVRLLPFKTQRMNHQIALLLERAGIAGPMKYVDYFRGIQPSKHILSLLAEEAGLRTPPPRPIFMLTDRERAAVLPKSKKPWVAIQSTGLAAWTDNKNWGGGKMAKVVDSLKSEYSFLQLGAGDDPALGADLNLCGKIKPREAVGFLAHCRGLIAQEGFLMHAAAAVGVPAVIVYGGFSAPWQNGYEGNLNLYNPVECAPCWLAESCPHGKRCLEEISPGEVVEGLRKVIHQYHSNPL